MAEWQKTYPHAWLQKDPSSGPIPLDNIEYFVNLY